MAEIALAAVGGAGMTPEALALDNEAAMTEARI
jgi:hypothetical protein